MSDFLSHPLERYKDFSVIQVTPIAELRATLRELKHEPSGACILHIECDDPENLFCLSFKTLPSSSNGAPHILEHTVLCGSRKFPVKDPFFAMTRRSLNTFMNALTGADFTCYPAASLVKKDFYNLLEVYLDAVFHPKISELSFLQEGHRLEFSKEGDPTSTLEYKGIVYNEMKGNLSSPDSRLWHAMLKHLTPDLTYASNAGGEPEEIPNLTYPELIEFYETYYHPSRCLFFFYGDLPLKEHLDFLEENALKGVLKEPPLPESPIQKRFDKPKEITIRYPTTEESNSTLFAIGFLTAFLKNQDEVLALCLLDSILMDTDGSILKHALLQSGLCTQVEAYLDTEMTEVPYVVLFKGCQEKDKEALESLLKTTLEKIVEEGIASHLIDSALHQLELSRTEITGDGNPFGLTLFMRSALAKQHGSAPEHALMLHTLFEMLLLKVKDPTYLPSLIEKYFLSNPHRVKLTMLGDKNLTTEETVNEEKKLAAIKASLSEEEKQKILKTAEELKEYQKSIENQDIECLPKVTLQDVPKETRTYSLTKTKLNDITVHHHESFTNHILYADCVFEIPELREEEWPYLHLLCTLLPELGSREHSYKENLKELHAHTGGLHVSCSLFMDIEDKKIIKPVLLVKGKALERKKENFFNLMADMLIRARFDEKKRIHELLLQIHTSLHSKLNRNAMRYASQQALSALSPAGNLNNLWYGVPYFTFINTLKDNLDLDNVIAKLEALYHKLFSANVAHLIVACDNPCFEESLKNNFYGFGKLPSKAFTKSHSVISSSKEDSQARIIAAQVAFNVEAFETVSYKHPHAPALVIAAQLLENKVLHAKVREQGGAYGSGASYSPMSGTFSFHSYRDPNIKETFNTFESSFATLLEEGFSEKDLEEAKLGIIQSIDAPLPPLSRAFAAFTWEQEGKTQEIRQQFRESILNLNPEALKIAIQETLIPSMKNTIRVSFAGKDLLEKEKIGKELAVYSL